MTRELVKAIIIHSKTLKATVHAVIYLVIYCFYFIFPCLCFFITTKYVKRYRALRMIIHQKLRISSECAQSEFISISKKIKTDYLMAETSYALVLIAGFNPG